MPTPSPDNTKSTMIVDSTGATWTLGTGGETLRDGVPTGSGRGSVYKYSSQKVYVLGTDSRWYVWGTSWTVTQFIAPNEPGGSITTTPEPPQPTPPKYTYTSAPWPSAANARLKLLNDMGATGQRWAGTVGSVAYFEKTV